ncbi:hypothetical protein Droror1_Dr00018243 [Drosera rotundifolia]
MASTPEPISTVSFISWMSSSFNSCGKNTPWLHTKTSTGPAASTPVLTASKSPNNKSNNPSSLKLLTNLSTPSHPRTPSPSTKSFLISFFLRNPTFFNKQPTVQLPLLIRTHTPNYKSNPNPRTETKPITTHITTNTNGFSTHQSTPQFAISAPPSKLRSILLDPNSARQTPTSIPQLYGNTSLLTHSELAHSLCVFLFDFSPVPHEGRSVFDGEMDLPTHKHNHGSQ